MSVIELSATYRLDMTGQKANLVLEASLRQGLIVSILHERYMRESLCYDFLGSFQQSLGVCSGESLTILTRAHGHIIGALVNEVRCAEEGRVLLLPKGGYNTIIYQNRMDDVELAPAITRALRPPTASTHLLATITRLLRQLELSRPDLKLALPALQGAVDLNDEVHSREMLTLLLAILEETGMATDPALAHLCQAAQELTTH